MGSLEGHGAWLPALSTSTLGVHSCPEEPAGHWHTRGRGSCPTYQPQPMQIGSGRITAGPKRFLPYSSAKITLPQKNKQHKQTLTSQHSPRPNPRQPDSHSAKEQRAANHERQDPCRVCRGELQGCGVQGQRWVRSDTAHNSMVGRESYLSPGRLVSCGF